MFAADAACCLHLIEQPLYMVLVCCYVEVFLSVKFHSSASNRRMRYLKLLKEPVLMMYRERDTGTAQTLTEVLPFHQAIYFQSAVDIARNLIKYRFVLRMLSQS